MGECQTARPDWEVDQKIKKKGNWLMNLEVTMVAGRLYEWRIAEDKVQKRSAR